MHKFFTIKLRNSPNDSERAAQWFSQKWGIPVATYRESIRQCITKRSEVPQWYLVVNSTGNIIAGAGVIDNDFHNRKDLSPNLCALFVEKEYRNQGIARHLLDVARNDFSKMGIHTLYLITDHTEFYEKCGWEFVTMVQEDMGTTARLYAAKTVLNNPNS